MVRLQWRRLKTRYPKLQILTSWKCLFLAIFSPLLIWYTIAAITVKATPLLETIIKQITVGNIEFDFQTSLYFFKLGNDIYLRGSVPDVLHEKGPPTHCGLFNSSKHLCAVWYSLVKLEVTNSVEEHSTCQTLKWTPTFNHYTPETCFSMADTNWYGGSLLSSQVWPLNKVDLALQSYQTQDLREYSGEATVIGNVLDWFWFSSSGVAIILDSKTPLYVSINQSGNNLLCFQASDKVINAVLKYTVCKSSNIRKIHRYLMSKFIQLPKSIPESEFFLKPSWSTAAVFNDKVNQDDVMKYALDIKNKEFSRHMIEIKDFDSSILIRNDIFSKEKFSNSHQTILYMKEYGFKTYISMTPCVNASKDLDKSNLLLGKDSKPVTVHMKEDDVHILDLLNAETKQWFVEKLLQIKGQYQLDGFTFFGGESNHLSNGDQVSDTKSFEIAAAFISVSDDLKVTPISSFAQRSQQYSGIVTLSHNETSWGIRGGLKSIIPSVLTLGVLGYPHVIPNVIGGLGHYKKVNNTYSIFEKPDKELYIRWIELAAYMPCMMFSFPPWYYDEEVVSLARELVKLHEEVVGPLVVKAAREYEISGAPIIRPLWWLHPTDATCQTIDDEYLIGDSMLVAPVVKQGMRLRNIYIPEGAWQDDINDEKVEGPVWLKDFHVDLEKIATFSKL